MIDRGCLRRGLFSVRAGSHSTVIHSMRGSVVVRNTSRVRLSPSARGNRRGSAVPVQIAGTDRPAGPQQKLGHRAGRRRSLPPGAGGSAAPPEAALRHGSGSEIPASSRRYRAPFGARPWKAVQESPSTHAKCVGFVRIGDGVRRGQDSFVRLLAEAENREEVEARGPEGQKGRRAEGQKNGPLSS